MKFVNTFEDLSNSSGFHPMTHMNNVDIETVHLHSSTYSAFPLS